MMRVVWSVVFLFLTLAGEAWSQVPDSKGRDFWFTFMPNFHNSSDLIVGDSAQRLQHQLYVYIGSDVPTTGTITLTNEVGVSYVHPFTIADPSKLHEFKVFYGDFELRGWNLTKQTGGIDLFGSQNEVVAKQAFHVETKDEVFVYALNQADLTSEAFMVLPTDALGVDYMVMSYSSNISPGLFEGTTASGSTPSQFAIVATEDGTTVTYNPSVKTLFTNRGQLRTIRLDKGESYLVQVDPLTNNNTADLTGTLVRSDKPIALFGGHQRALIPIELASILSSRDCLIEQMTPLGTWGKSAYLTPLANSSDELNTGNNLFRVGAAFDSTVVYVDGVEMTVLNAGEFYQAPLVTASEVVGSKPIQVAMFKKTTGVGGAGGSRYGDPFMMLVPPAEQFMSSYRFINIQAYSYIRNFFGNVVLNDTVYDEQYLNIVVPTVSIPSLVLDGANIPAARFLPIGSTDHSYAQIVMRDGVHEISSDTLFGIYVYGYGQANSYGYIGGMAFRPLDNYPPRVSGNVKCGVFTGAVTDSALGDSRLRSVSVVQGSEENVVFTLGTFAPPQAVVSVSVGLVNPYQDGRISLEATDNVLQTATIGLDIAGFTLHVTGNNENSPMVQRRLVVPRGVEACDTFQVTNYGRHPQRVTNVRSQRGATVSEPILPVNIPPGSSVEFIMCRSEPAVGVYTDTLIIGDSCASRSIIEQEIDARNDEVGPNVDRTINPCATKVEVVVSDNRPFDFGLETSYIMQNVLQNCTIEADTSQDRIHRYTITILNPFLDAVYGFFATDSAKNITEVIDTIQGFTLSINGVPDAFSSGSMPTTRLGEYTCNNITLTNYGILPFTVSQIFVRNNLRFSLPQNQLSITLSPGASAPITVCYEPTLMKELADLDTLEFGFGCYTKLLELSGFGEAVAYDGVSRCNVPITTSVGQLKTDVTAVPQPADNEATLVFMRSTEKARIRIVSLSGEVVKEFNWRGAATRSLRIELNGIAPGTYGCMIQHDGGNSAIPLIIR